jgi:hypothetical protein
MFEDKSFRDMMWSFDPTGAIFYKELVKDFVDLEFNFFLLILGRALQDSAKFHCGNPFAQLSHDAAWLSNHQSYEQLSIQFITADFQNLTASVIYENMPSGASEDIASAFKVTLAKRGIDTCTVLYPTWPLWV